MGRPRRPRLKRTEPGMAGRPVIPLSSSPSSRVRTTRRASLFRRRTGGVIHEYRLVAKVFGPHDRYELHVVTDVVTIEVTAEATDFRRVPGGPVARHRHRRRPDAARRLLRPPLRPDWRPAHRRRPERGTPRHPPAAHADPRRLTSWCCAPRPGTVPASCPRPPRPLVARRPARARNRTRPRTATEPRSGWCPNRSRSAPPR